MLVLVNLEKLRSHSADILSSTNSSSERTSEGVTLDLSKTTCLPSRPLSYVRPYYFGFNPVSKILLPFYYCPLELDVHCGLLSYFIINLEQYHKSKKQLTNQKTSHVLMYWFWTHIHQLGGAGSQTPDSIRLGTPIANYRKQSNGSQLSYLSSESRIWKWEAFNYWALASK